MKQKKTASSNADTLPNRGLLVGVPLFISLLFSGLYTLTSQSDSAGKPSSSQTSQQSSPASTNVQVVTPPKASKLTTEPVTPTNLNPPTAGDSLKKPKSTGQSNDDAADKAQKSVTETPQGNKKDTTFKLQSKSKINSAN